MSAIFSKGTIILGTYRIDEMFEGGMGVVYRARHLAWGIDLAIKHSREGFLIAKQQRDGFEQECRLWTQIGLHPYVATCFYTRNIEETPCAFAEFVDGGSLRDWIASRRLYSGEMDAALARMISVSVQTAWGLARAHQGELLHCDMKPGNVLMTIDGTAKVTDFGLAKLLEGGVALAAGSTKVYASPEQVRTEPLTKATDVWSWAATVLEMFTGGICWEIGPAVGAALAEFGERGAKGVGVSPMPRPVFDLLTRCLNWKPEERPESFSEIARELLEIYENLFNEPCDAQEPDLDIIASDSLNNRAVSLLDLGRVADAEALLEQALVNDPQHPEATFNLALIRQMRGEPVESWLTQNLRIAAEAEPGNSVPCKLLGLFYARAARQREAADLFAAAKERAWTDAEAAEINRLCTMTGGQETAFVLAQPRTGADFFADVARFRRLMNKTEKALAEKRFEDAARYTRMAGDIQGFGRHPQLRRALTQLRT
jgi:serine/threonine protein kinase